MENDTLIFFGDAVKALDDNGRIGAIGIRFGSKQKKDLANEYFTAKTYLGPHEGNGAECLFDHGYPVGAGLEEYADKTFAPVKTRRDKLGIWAETVLDLSDSYEKAVFEMAKRGKLGWSSASSSHRVRKNADGEITSWPVSEFSLTMRPCEPDNYGTALPLKSFAAVKFVGLDGENLPTHVSPVSNDPSKSLTLAVRLTRRLDDLIDDGHDKVEMIKQMAREAMCEVAEVEAVLDGTKRRPSNAHLKAFARVLSTPYDMLRSLADRQRKDPQTIKSAFDDMVTEEMAEGPCAYELFSYYAKLARDIQTMASASQTTGTPFDVNMKVHELALAYLPYLEHTTVAQILDSLEPHDDNALYDPNEFYLKALTKLDVDTFRNLTKGIDLDTHSELVVSAFRDISARFKANNEARKNQKAGRVLSDKNRKRLAELVAAIKQSVSDAEALLEETKPMATDEAMRAVQTRQLARRSQRRQAQLGA